jgi:endonuclease/exonuclease/phosphatase family metal-dependent hydrolase
MKYLGIFYFSFLFVSNIFGQQSVYIDENFDDWKQKFISADTKNDQLGSNIDIENMQVYNDDNYLFIKFKLSSEIKLQENNALTIFIDTDDNIATGTKVNGIGAELVYGFGRRSGNLNVNNRIYNVAHNHIGLISAPSVSSSEFELMFSRNANVNGVQNRMTNTVKIVLSDEIVNGDKLPNTGGLSYTMQNSGTTLLKSYSFSKQNASYIRIMSNNAERDNLFKTGSSDAQQRIIAAVDADIIAFQELYDASPATVEAMLNNVIQLPNARKWKAAKGNPDVILATKYEITNFKSIDGNAIFLVNTGSKYLVVINVHLPCCENDADRQAEVDNIIATIRKVRTNSGLGFDVPKNTPIIFTGDTNFVGLNQQLKSIITGDIINQSVYGADFKPDWDNSDFEDAKPYTIGVPASYTWYSLGNSYMPGRLDYVLYTGSVMKLENCFVLQTINLSQNDLQNYYLSPGDSDIATDHLPLVCDFNLNTTTTISFDEKINDIHIYPNPTTNEITISGENLSGNLFIYNSMGQLVGEKLIEINEPYDVSKLTNGIYYLRIFNEKIRTTWSAKFVKQ